MYYIYIYIYTLCSDFLKFEELSTILELWFILKSLKIGYYSLFELEFNHEY
jgi:hypothetical protein